MLCDFHLHSTFSDGQLTIPELVDLYGSKGFGAIAITDHLCDQSSPLGRAARILGRSLTEATYPLYRSIVQSETERAFEQYGMVLISGVEITLNRLSQSRSAHVVALGVAGWVDVDHPPEKVLEDVRAQGALTVAAHPLFTGKLEPQTYFLWNHRHEVSHLIDAWEVNHRDRVYEEVLDEKLPIIASSDFHHPKHLQSWKTVLSCERRQEAILSSIKTQQLGIEYYADNSVSSLALPYLGHSADDAPLGNLACVEAEAST